MKVVTVNRDGQVTIPAAFRRKYNFKFGTKVALEEIGPGVFKLTLAAKESSS